MDEDAHRREHEYRLAGGGRPREGHERAVVAPCADDRQHALRQCEQQREDQGELAELGDHLGVSFMAVSSMLRFWCAFAMASFSSFGM